MYGSKVDVCIDTNAISRGLAQDWRVYLVLIIRLIVNHFLAASDDLGSLDASTY